MTNYKHWFFVLALSLYTTYATAVPMAYVAGQHYQATSSLLPKLNQTKQEVVELFMYTCPHCYHLESEVTDWLPSLESSTTFTRMPAVFNQKQVPLATAFYAAQALELSETLHPLFFEAIHEDGIRLESEKAILDFVAAQGIDRASFAKMMTSFTVKTQVKKARRYTAMSGITGVPAFVVNGKYQTSGPQAGSIAAIFEVVDYLLQH